MNTTICTNRLSKPHYHFIYLYLKTGIKFEIYATDIKYEIKIKFDGIIKMALSILMA
jgi:hypothetical protein